MGERQHTVRWVAGSVLVAVVLVALWGYLTPKRWEASTTVRLDPVVVPGLREDAVDPAAPDPLEAVALELAAARGDRFQDGLASTRQYPYEVAVSADPGAATLTFTATADSSERAHAGSYSAANGWLAWGRAQEAVARRGALEREVAALGAGDPSAEDLTARLAAATAAIEQLAGGGSGEVVEEPTIPVDPVSPDLAARLLVAVGVGLVVGLALAVGVEGARPTSAAAAASAELRRRPTRSLLAVVTVAALAVPSAAVLAGVVELWEARPTTNAQDEAGYACLPDWLADIPDGTLVAISGSSPRFFYDHFAEFAFPRLVVPPPGGEPDVLVTIVPGPGPDQCGGFHRELSRP